MNKSARVAGSTLIMTAGLGLAGLGTDWVAQAQPAPLPAYHWCPGWDWDDAWGVNWDWGRCHDDHFYDGDFRDEGHWHNGPWDGNWDRDHWQGGNPGDQGPGGHPGDQGPGGHPGDQGPGGPGGGGHGH